jgi:hypothetical protein
MVNVRRGLMQDASFEWDAAIQPPEHWDYALRFRAGQRTATLLFALEPPSARLMDRDQPTSTRPIAAGLRAFFSEQFGEVR